MDAHPIVTGICGEASSVDYQDPSVRILERSGESFRVSHASANWGKCQIWLEYPEWEGRFRDGSTGHPGRLLLLVQPGRRADIGTPAQCLIETGHLQRRGMADEYLAREIDTQAAVL
jgi:hypothetical protein